VTAAYIEANAQSVDDVIGAPIEEPVNGVENMMYMSWQSTNDGPYPPVAMLSGLTSSRLFLNASSTARSCRPRIGHRADLHCRLLACFRGCFFLRWRVPVTLEPRKHGTQPWARAFMMIRALTRAAFDLRI